MLQGLVLHALAAQERAHHDLRDLARAVLQLAAHRLEDLVMAQDRAHRAEEHHAPIDHAQAYRVRLALALEHPVQQDLVQVVLVVEHHAQADLALVHHVQEDLVQEDLVQAHRV